MVSKPSPWVELQAELLETVAERLPAKSFPAARAVNRHWRSVLDGCRKELSLARNDTGQSLGRFAAQFPCVSSLQLQDCRWLTARGMRALDQFTALTELDLSQNPAINAWSLKALHGLTQLQSLALRGCANLRSDALASLAHLTRLSALDLSFCRELSIQAAFCALQRLPRLAVLRVSFCWDACPAGFDALEGMGALEQLDLRGCAQLTDGAALRVLPRLTRLEGLLLSSCWRLTDAALAGLAPLTRLTSLHLAFCHQLSGSGLTALSGMGGLSELNLSNCWGLSDAGLAALPTLPTLLTLGMWGNRGVSDAQLQALLAPLTALRTLNLAHSCAGRAAVAAVARLPHLRSLSLADTEVRDAQLRELAPLRELALLDLRQCAHVTGRGVAALRKCAGLERVCLARCPRIKAAGRLVAGWRGAVELDLEGQSLRMESWMDLE